MASVTLSGRTKLARRCLGRSSVEVSVMGLGGAPYAQTVDEPADIESRALIRSAYDGGVRYFDTAPLYGLGLSERRLGNGLRYLPPDYAVSTKVGRCLVPPGQGDKRTEFAAVVDYGYDAAFRAVEQSLQRLGLNRIDIVLIHDLDIWTHGNREAYEQRLGEAMDGAWPALAKMRADGTVGAIGIGVNEIEPCMRFAEATDIDCMMLAGRYTLLEHEAARDLLWLCERKSISLLIGGPYNSGILVTGAVPGATYNYQPASPAMVAHVARIEEIARSYSVPLAACALQFPLAHPAVAAVVPGAINRAEVARNLESLSTPIPAALWDDLKDAGLLPPDALTPAAAIP